MKRILLTLLSAAIIAQAALAQSYTFKVMGSKGANEIKTGGKWEPMKIYSLLQAGDEIKVSPNAYIALVHSSGRPIEWREPGVFKVTDLEANVKEGTSVVNKYTDFIMSNNSAEAKKNRLSATGAVTRATGESIKVFLPGNQDAGLYNTFAIVTWEDENPANRPYIVTLKSLFDDELLKIEANETNVKIDLSNPRFANENAILVSVHSKANPRVKSQDFILKKLSASHYATVKAGLAEILPELSEETALNKFLLAGFYEQNKLMVDALTAYREAINLAPDVPSYQEAYEDFLVRNRLK
ncbi:MAG TPA: hypothetical protein PKC24_08445 [Cyclobacteriaceae bacterium]|nr:hypothetical protein [Cyclobacteriaceae bacterium]